MKYPTTYLILGIASILILSGCATTPERGPAVPLLRTAATFDATVDQVWPLVVAEIGLSYPIAVVEKDSGLITTDFVLMDAGYNNRFMTDWVRSPGGFLAVWDGLRMKMNVMVVEVGAGQTRVSIRAHFEAYEDNARKTWVVCTSIGAVESGILDRIAVQLVPAG